MNVRPFRDYLLVRRIEERETQTGGMVVPHGAKAKGQAGKVLAVGNVKGLDGGTNVAPGVKVGDKILFGAYSGTEIRVDGEAVLVVREDQILGLLE